MGIRPVCGLSKGSPCDCSIRQSKNGDAHAGTTTSSGQESNGLSPPARHYDSDSHRDTGIHCSAGCEARWILRCAIAPHSSLVALAPRNDSAFFPLVPSGKSPLEARASRPDKRGAFRNRHERWVRDAMDALVPSRRAASKRTAKSCGPDISTLISSRRMIRRRWWQESPIARESTKETVKTIRVRECRVVRQYLRWTYSCAFFFCT